MVVNQTPIGPVGAHDANRKRGRVQQVGPRRRDAHQRTARSLVDAEDDARAPVLVLADEGADGAACDGCGVADEDGRTVSDDRPVGDAAPDASRNGNSRGAGIVAGHLDRDNEAGANEPVQRGHVR